MPFIVQNYSLIRIQVYSLFVSICYLNSLLKQEKGSMATNLKDSYPVIQIKS